MKKILAIIISTLYVFSFVACTNSSGNGGNSEVESASTPSVEAVENEEMEKEYVHAWNKSGVGGVDKIVNVQTENYALTTNATSGGITSIGGYFSSENGKYTRCDFSKLLNVSSMKYTVTYEEDSLTFNRQTGYQRVIESGRYVQRYDYNSLLNSKDLRWTGRMEVTATLSHLAINYEVHNGSDKNQTLGLKFNMKFEDSMESIELASRRGLTLRSSSGQGITVMRVANDDETQISYENGVLTVSNDDINSIKGTFSGFGVIIIPSNDATTADEKILESVENCVVSAINVDNQDQIPVTYDSRRGIFALDISSVNGASQSTDAGRNTYDRVKFTIKNNGENETRVPLSFQHNGNFSVTGLSPMIRDAETLEPTGIQVQISKNWHTHTSVSSSDPKRLYEGKWYNGSTVIAIPSHGEVSYEYTCAYGEWGGVYSASHGQLCLIGWGGANNMLWEESALGSWGESITYDPDMGLGRAMIDDVRPFLVTSENHGNQKFNWSGNVGGANFLDYYPTAKQSKIIDLIPTYKTQAPNLTDVNYSGVTSDGAISADITVNMGRTDDVVRAYYTIKYTFLEDVEPERLSFFKLCADGYADNNFRKYALGDETGAKQVDVPIDSVSLGVNGNGINQAGNGDFWFKLYDSSNYKEENSDVSFIVRNYKANINGKIYDRPSYRIVGIQDGYLQPSCELTAPAGVNKIKKGSIVEIKIEYLVLPADANSYYGESDYILESKLFGTYASTFEQVLGGKIQASASVGKVKGTYPVEIEGVDGTTVAQFTISGGLGYVPVKITGVNGYKGYQLQKLVQGNWENIVQVGNPTNTNDYWQVYYNSSTKKYEFAFNVKNTNGLDFGASTEYRLIKI